MDTKSSGPRATPGGAESARPTPGPWRIGRPSVMHGVQVFHDSDIPMSSVPICGEVKRAADARLIASAPDLRDALARIVNAPKGHGRAESIAAARTLLARIDGGQHG